MTILLKFYKTKKVVKRFGQNCNLVDCLNCSVFIIQFCLLLIYLCHSGPLAEFVSNKFSCRLSMLTGGLLLSLSYVISAFVDSVDILIPVIGVIGGKLYNYF